MRWFSLLFCLSLFVVSGCADPYIGLKLNKLDGPYTCTGCAPLPASCRLGEPDGPFDFDFTISGGPQEYLIEGDAIYTGKGGFSHLVDRNCQLRFYFLDNGRIVSSTGVMLYGLGDSRHFKKTFSSPYFDGVTLSMKYHLRG